MKPLDLCCSKCKWFDRFNSHGYCHRYAPRPLNHERGDEWSYPVVTEDGWCGDFEEDKSLQGVQ